MLTGKSAVVTGSTSGIGLGIAKALAQNGANVMINGFDDVAAPLAAVGAYGTVIEHHPADMTKPAEIAALVARAEALFGQVDILVNNVAVHYPALIEDILPEDWDKTIATNLTSAYHMTRLLLPGMKARNWGRIVNLSSPYGHVGQVGWAAYITSKHGMIGLTKAVAMETVLTGVTCNALCPGWTRTERTQGEMEEEAQKAGITVEAAEREAHLKEGVPSLKFIRNEDVAAMAMFLCGPSADQVRGASFSMDDGFLAR